MTHNCIAQVACVLLGLILLVGVGAATKLGYFKRFEQDDEEKSSSRLAPVGRSDEQLL